MEVFSTNLNFTGNLSTCFNYAWFIFQIIKVFFPKKKKNICAIEDLKLEVLDLAN